MTSYDNLLGIREVMRLLNVTRQIPYRWDRSGLLKAVTLPGGGKRWRAADIQAIVQGKPVTEGQP